MVTIGVDPHKEAHSAVATDLLGRELSKRTARALHEGFGELLVWGASSRRGAHLGPRGRRNVSGPLERFLIDNGETVIRLPLRIRLLCVHCQRLVDSRTRLANQLRWELHDLWPGWNTSRERLRSRTTQEQIARRLSCAEPTIRVRIARDMIRRIRDLFRTINELYEELSGLVSKVAPQLLAEKGLGVITAATLTGEIAGVDRFDNDARLARLAGCAPVPVSSGRTDRYRLDRGGNRQLNHAVHMLALSRIRHDPETAIYMAKQRGRGKTQREATRCLKRHLIRRIFNLLPTPNEVPITVCLT